MIEGTVPVERRMGADRRAVPHWAEWRWVFGGRRRRLRRASDRRMNRIDHYPAPLLGAVVMILGLSTLDAGFTLLLLQDGLVVEANPLMASLLGIDVQLFVNLKTALTGSCMIMLVLYSQGRFLGQVRVGHVLYAIAALYMLLIGYELVLLSL